MTTFPSSPLRLPFTIFIVNDMVNPYTRLGNCYIGVIEPHGTHATYFRVQNYLENYRIIKATGNMFPVRKKNYFTTFHLFCIHETRKIYEHYREIFPYPKNHYYWTIEANFQRKRTNGNTDVSKREISSNTGIAGCERESKTSTIVNQIKLF